MTSPRVALLIVPFVALALAGAAARAAPPKIEAPGGVFINSTTLGATIEIDGKVVGKVPIEESIVLMPGEHTIKVHLRGHTQFQDRFTVAPGEEVELEIDLIPFAGIVKVDTPQPGATVKVDGKVEGTTPFDKDIPVGKRQIVVSFPGFLDATRELDVRAGEAYNVDFILKPLPKKTDEPVGDSDAFYETWWFWTIVGVAGAGAVTAIAVTSGGEAAAPTPAFTLNID
ncbi:MAG: PEGA domain-containing protein [Deltaproteobacteria bacterium]|nr:PEGA domain-containing protein [Deltaproteobacteria bacterium]